MLALRRTIWRHRGSLPFVRINRLGRLLVRVFSKISKPTERNDTYHLQFDFPKLFSADERLKTGKFRKWYGNFRRSVPNEKRGLPLEVAYNFRTEKYCNSMVITMGIQGKALLWSGYDLARQTLSKGPFTQAIFFAATRCNFYRSKIAPSFNHVRNPALSRRQMALKIAPGLHLRFWSCNFSATKIASSCRDKNRLCKRALINSVCAHDIIRVSNPKLKGHQRFYPHQA